MPKPKKIVAGPRPIAAYVRVNSKHQKADSQRDVIAQ